MLRVAGAGYLLLLGVRTLLAARRSREVPVQDGVTDVGRRSVGPYRTGMLTNLLNPKVGVFYVTLLPQFIPRGVPVLPASLLLAGIHAVEGIIWLSLVCFAVSRAGALLRRASVRRGLERVTGLVLIGFGARVAVERL